MNESNSFARVARDILDLCELQVQLLSVDSQVAKRKLISAIACSVSATTLAVPAFSVLMLAAGYWIAEVSDLSIAGGLFVIGTLVFSLVVVLLVISLLALKAAAAAMSETKSEFAENIRWLKATLVSPDSSARNQLRSESFRPAVYSKSPVSLPRR